MNLEAIRNKITQGDYRFSDHAVKRMIKRSISREELQEAVVDGEIIEEYPEDKYSPSCLIYRKTKTDRDLHIQLSLPPKIVIITTYDPDPSEWIDFVKRR